MYRNKMCTLLTGNVLAAARAIGQQTDVLATAGGRLVGRRLRIQRLRTGRRESVDVDELLRLGDDGAGRFQRGTGATVSCFMVCSFSYAGNEKGICYLRRMGSSIDGRALVNAQMATTAANSCVRVGIVRSARSVQFAQRNGRKRVRSIARACK